MMNLAPFIEIRDLTVRFGDVVALRNINLTGNSGQERLRQERSDARSARRGGISGPHGQRDISRGQMR